MKLIIKFFPKTCLAGVILASVAIITAQDVQPKAIQKQISGGILNGKATSLPKPEYPAEARAEKAAGKVGVQVLIDEAGNVVSAKAVSGPENTALRMAAETAAMSARFSPTTLSGAPVKVSGVITYNFVAQTNEERVKPLGVSTFLSTIRYFSSDLSKFNKTFGPGDPIAEVLDEFSSFADLKALAGIEKLPPDKRGELIDRTAATIRSNLDKSEQWQFDLGEHFTKVTAPIMALNADDTPDLSKLTPPVIKAALLKMKAHLELAPNDFPGDVLAQFNRLADFASHPDLTFPGGMLELIHQIEAVIVAIKPGIDATN